MATCYIGMNTVCSHHSIMLSGLSTTGRSDSILIECPGSFLTCILILYLYHITMCSLQNTLVLVI